MLRQLYQIFNYNLQNSHYKFSNCTECSSSIGRHSYSCRIKGYQQKIGKLIFAAVTTQPDISRAVIKLSQFLTNPGSQYLEVIYHRSHYSVSTPYLATCYKGNFYSQKLSSTKRAFMTFSDSSYGDESVTRHSSCGFAL